MPGTAMASVAFEFEQNAAISTWFGIGGGADRLARPRTAAELVACLEMDQSLRVLGDGANLLVDDAGVGELVVDFKPPRTPLTPQTAQASSGLGAVTGELAAVEIDASGRVRVGAGADLQKLVMETARRGLRGLEVLYGIPATIGGAVIMNAGGAFGEIANVIESVDVMDRSGRVATLERGRIGFGYRRSGLSPGIVVGAVLRLTPDDAVSVRARLKEIAEYKKTTQPLSANSAGCVFKNPTLTADIEGVAAKGARVSAGMLIDRAGCKGLRVGGASVSERHANFVVTEKGAKAAEVISLMVETKKRVRERFGVELEPEVVVWGRGSG
jgi:UDP-N-acetylmuramate dehydrogenase